MALEWKQEHPEFKNILYDKAEGIAKITMNRPEKMNGANSAMTKEMEQAFLDAWHDDDIGVVVLTGTGRAFCTGGDVSERDPETGKYKGVQWNGIMTMIHYLIITKNGLTEMKYLMINCVITRSFIFTEIHYTLSIADFLIQMAQIIHIYNILNVLIMDLLVYKT